MLDLAKLFEQHSDEFLRFERVESPAHTRPDLCAFLLLSELDPRKAGTDMVSAAEHDEIWLAADADTVARNATEHQIVTLIRCGVRFDAEYQSFAMYV